MAHQFEKKWRSQDVQLQENIDFSAMLLDDRVLSGLKKAGFKKPSPIQLEAIPIGRFGKDLLVQAKSGTGKTLVFVTVALEMLKRRLYRPQVLILAPTREIATQICSVIKTVGSSFSKLTCNCFIGGLAVSNDKEKSLTSQIVVGTPGRIRQLITLKALPTKSIRLLVFDEADKLLENTFKEEIQEIFSSLPEDKQVIATSATYPTKLAQLIMHFLKEPYMACLNSKELALLGIIHYAKLVKYSPMPILSYRSKLHVLEGILKTIKFAQCLLFCNGVQKVEVLYRDVKKWGFSATYISSAKEQPERLKAIDRLKNFKCKVLVSSDVTARGIDAENVDLVINFDLSYGTETYLHRAGRAGRYGSVGVAITIVDENEIEYLRLKEQEGSFKVYKLPDPVPSDLILNPVFGEYFIGDSESQKGCSKKVKSAGNANGECNNTKSGKIEDKVKLTSDKTLNESDHVSAEQKSTERIPISENNVTPLQDVPENSSLKSDTEPNGDFKSISSNAENEKTVHVSDKTANVELFEGSSEIDGLHDKEEFSKDVPGDDSEEVVIKSLDKGVDLMNSDVILENTSATVESLNDVIRAYTETYEANRDNKCEASKLLQDLKDEWNLRKGGEANGDEESVVSKDEGRKIISETGLKTLQSMSRDYVYRVFKKYQESKCESQGTCSGVNNEHNRAHSVLLQDETFNESDSASEVVNKKQNAPESKDFIEESHFENIPKFSEKANYESTPQSVGKQKFKKASTSCNSRLDKLAQGMMKLFQEESDSSSFDDTELSDGNNEVIQNSSLEDSSSDSCSDDSSDFHSSSSSLSSYSEDCESDSSSSSSSSSESCCSSCSSASSTDSDSSAYAHARKQKKFLASRHSERPVRNLWQHSPRPSKNLGRSHHDHSASRQGYFQPPLLYSEIPTNREYQRYVPSNTHKSEKHRNQSKASRGHVCSGNCFLPSQHRYYHQHPCDYGQACLQWYQMFYHQWRHLQNAVLF